MLISVHIPKTAGTSFRVALEKAFGHRLFLDYGKPVRFLYLWKFIKFKNEFAVYRRAKRLVQRYSIIHGHFVASKYDPLPEPKQFCTILRQPVDRVISHYLQWTNSPQYKERGGRWIGRKEPIRDVHEFAELRAMMRCYRAFLGGNHPKNIEELDFVGLTEEYDATLRLFEKMFGVKLENSRRNITAPKRYEKLQSGKVNYDLLRWTQAENQDIYDRGRLRFEQLCEKYGV